jgi:uncharacterized protein
MSRERFSPVEFALVIGVAFGYSILGSINALLSGRTVGQETVARSFDDTHMYGVVLYELIVAPVLLTILYLGGWRLQDLKVAPSVSSTVLGLTIFSGMWLGEWGFSWLMQIVFPAMRSIYELLAAYRPAEAPTLTAIVLVSLINPLFEELFVCGYAIEALRRQFGTTVAINVSVVIRTTYHLYQGIAYQPFHIAYGLVQGYVYVRYDRLWPLFVSHALLDFIPMAFYLR